MAKRVAPISPLDSEVEFEIKQCMERVEGLQSLKRANESAYNEEVTRLQLICLGKRIDAETSPGMAESILLELEEVNPISSSREDLEALFAEGSEDEFLGDSETFVPFEEAVRKGEIPRDKL